MSPTVRWSSIFVTWIDDTGIFSSYTLGHDLVERCGIFLDQLKINETTQIEAEPTHSRPRTFEDKETQAESIQYYDVENAKETPGQGSTDLFANGLKSMDGPSLKNPEQETVTELAFHGLSEAVGFLGADLESRLSLEAKTLYYKRLFDW